MRTLLALVLTFVSVSGIAQNVLINEVLAINKGLYRDSTGKSEDCIEIYNKSDQPINLAGYYLSDSKDTLTKWKFPNGTQIGAKKHLIVWADNDPNEPGLHTNFKLNSKGESIRLSDKEGKQIHKLKYKRQYKNVSFGYLPDGSETKSYMVPTIGKANKSSAHLLGYDKKLERDSIDIRPNHDHTAFIVNNNTGKKVRVVVRNKEDQVFHRSFIEESKGFVYLEELKSGKYELQIGRNTYRIIKN